MRPDNNIQNFSHFTPEFILNFCHKLMGKNIQKVRSLCEEAGQAEVLVYRTTIGEVEEETLFTLEILVGDKEYLLRCELKEKGKEGIEYHINTPCNKDNFYIHRIFLYFKLSHKEYFVRLLNDITKYTKLYDRFKLNDLTEKCTVEFSVDADLPTQPPCLIFQN